MLIEFFVVCFTFIAVICVNLSVASKQCVCFMNEQLWGFHRKNLEHE